MAYQSLYRRYRPNRFSELRGQSHVVTALVNALRTDSVTHAYLFSGPRGTGKTSTARILAKALNCENLQDGEPCGECQSCQDMVAGRSFDLFELDAASNNGVDAIRDLVERASVGSPGRTKVYILDEVHMLSTAASNALLKTLEEPPGHVRFVLATTDPQKVLPTIRSRTQHFEFQLLSATELEEYVRWVGQDAELDLDEEAIHWAVRQGKGSARDTLSALDQVVAAGGVVDRVEPVEALLDALVASDPGAAVLAVADALNLGHDPRVLGRSLLDTLRDLFLISLNAPVPHLVPADVERLGSWAAQLGTPRLTRAIDAVGTSLVEMRNAADPRIPLEVALVRLTRADGDSLDGLLARIEKLEATVAELNDSPGARVTRGASSAEDSSTATTPAPAAPAPEPAPGRATGSASERLSGPALARAELARQKAKRGDGSSSAPRVPRDGAAPSAVPSNSTNSANREQGAPPSVPRSDTTRDAAPPPEPVSNSEGSTLSVEALNEAMAGHVLSQMKGVAKALYTQGNFVSVDGATVVFSVENEPTRDRAERSRSEVEGLLSAHFGKPLALRLVASDSPDHGRPAPNDSGGPGSNRPPRAPTPPAVPGPSHQDHDKGDRSERAETSGRVVEQESDLPDEMSIDVSELEDAVDVAQTGLERILEAFPGATVIQENSDTQ